MVHPGAKESFYCEPCDTTFLFQGNETEGSREDEQVHCPDCHAALGWLRCDVYAPVAPLRRAKGKHENLMED